MDIFSVFTLLGGLAFFLYGMNVMSSGLEKMVGGKLERVLRTMTSNKWKALLLGAIITITVQSSSAVTVMLVGLVNSGIMQLSQTTGVIIGSGIGTTLTSWILSLTGIESESFFLRMLKPESFSPLIALVGILLIMAGKKDRHKNIGSILLGFSILMTGMTLMGDSVEPLADMPQFQDILMMFRNPVAGILIGTIFTGIIQSSAATVGILQSLALTGNITFGMAFPLILGANIGTCVTGLLSCMGANKNAKRVAVINLYLKAIGAVLVMGIFYGANAFFHFEFVDAPINAVGIAIVHTLFNVINTFLFMPFTNQLEKLAKLTIRDKNNKEELLDERLLNSPSFAIAECRTMTVRMAKTAQQSMLLAIEMLKNFDAKKMEEISRMEDELDLYEDKLGAFLVQLSGKDLTEADSTVVSELLHDIGDFERIGDHAVNLQRAAQEMHDKELVFSEKAQLEIDVITKAIVDIMDKTVTAFENDDRDVAAQVEPLEQVIDDLKKELKSRHIRRLREGKCTIELGFVLSDVLTNFERVSDHCSNIAVTVLQVRNSTLESHNYLNEVKSTGDPEFVHFFDDYQQTYHLPE